MPGRSRGLGAEAPGVDQLLYLGLAWWVGVVVCTVIARRVVVRLGLPWRETLMYFGVMPYPDEVLVRARPEPRKRSAARPAA